MRVNSMDGSDPVVRGACGHDCPDTCSWVVSVRNGVAETLVGDPTHPFTRGVLCAKVNHYLERVYHPDRVLYPLKRIGAKGEGQFARVTWDEALADIASRWQAIVSESGAEAILPYSSAGVQGLVQMHSLDRRLFGSMGCSGLDRNICGAVAAAGLAATIGTGTGIDPEEIVHSRFVVLWGTNTIVTNLHFWPFVREARQRGAKIVVVDPIRTQTASEADWHLQIKPGSDAALALAMMHVIIRDGLVDDDYVARHAIGFDALVERAREYAPETVAGAVGLPAADIERFAREYATTQPSLLRPLIGIEHHRHGAMQFRTLGCLPVLTGAWKHRGGGLARSTHALQFATLAMDRVLMPEVYKPGVRVLNMRDLGNDLCSADLQPPIRSLIVYGANPMVSMPNQRRIREGLLRDDLFTVVHDLFVTDTALYADYVLPATSQIEHLDLAPAWGHLYLALNRPAIAPRGESVSNTELFRRLARALGRTEAWLFESDESMLRAALASGHPWLDGISYERLWDEGYARLNRPQGWMPFANGGFATRSGKAELYSEPLRAAGHDPLPAAGDIPRGGGLQLISGKQLHFLNSGYNNMERHRRRAGSLFIEVHADDARRCGVADGELVSVRSERGELHAVCRVSARVAPGVAWMPFGGFADADGHRHSVNALTPEEPTDWGGGSGFYDAFVEISPVIGASSIAVQHSH
ncbi:MAG TPA: molybdopterin-dependent oxidoreductase [Vicinamibacterales bacterium]|nr:molybdopterin-dependent oxidoreductase [Vicinamibacterales bacterium]